MGFEPTTSTLARLRSTPELRPHCARPAPSSLPRDLPVSLAGRRRDDGPGSCEDEAAVRDHDRDGFRVVTINTDRTRGDGQDGVERAMRFELTTSGLGSRRSTAELRPRSGRPL